MLYTILYTSFVIMLFIVVTLMLINYVNHFSFSKRSKHHENIRSPPPPPPPKLNITIFTIETRPISLVPLHNKNVGAYAERHGYTYQFSDSYNSPYSLPVYWWKLQKMQELMDTDAEYLMWMDSDTMFCNHDFKLEHLISLAPDASIFIAKDYLFGYVSQYFASYCAGVFIIKNNDVGKRFVAECIDTYLNSGECKCKETGSYTLNGIWAGPCYEQGVMNTLIRGKYAKDVYTVPTDYIYNGDIFKEYFLPGVNIYDTFILHRFGKDKEAVYKDLKRVEHM